MTLIKKINETFEDNSEVKKEMLHNFINDIRNDKKFIKNLNLIINDNQN